MTVSATVSNTGVRTGKYVWQVYLEREGSSAVDRPAVWLAGYAVARVSEGEQAVLKVRLEPRRFAHWSVDDHAWRIESCSYVVTAGTSVDDRSVVGRVTL